MDIALVFIFGLFLGSFYNVVAMRTLKGENIATGRSHCTVCNHVLGVLDLVPVFSYIFLRGKCRYCKTKISPLYCLGELATGITLAYVYWLFGLSIDFVIHFVLGSILVILTITDLIEKIVPNKIVFAGLVLILLFRIISGENLAFYILSSIGVFIFLFLLMIASKDKLGGGDVKLYAVISLAIGAWKAFASIFFASFVALLITLPMILKKKMDRKTEIPFVPFIWVGVLISYIVEINLL